MVSPTYLRSRQLKPKNNKRSKKIKKKIKKSSKKSNKNIQTAAVPSASSIGIGPVAVAVAVAVEAAEDDGFQLCPDNIPVTVTVGDKSNPNGSFVNIPLEQSLENVIDCFDVNEGEDHTQATHVWWNPGPLELVFDFGGVEYDLLEVNFWNYFEEGFDDDQIDFEFLKPSG
jgi:hypothetical protein